MSKEIEEIYKDYDVNSIKWMEKNNCTTTKEITLKLMELAVQSKLSELERENERMKEITDVCCVPAQKQLLVYEDEITKLKEIIKEAINLPKGVEPHSYSDYLTINTNK